MREQIVLARSWFAIHWFCLTTCRLRLSRTSVTLMGPSSILIRPWHRLVDLGWLDLQRGHELVRIMTFPSELAEVVAEVFLEYSIVVMPQSLAEELLVVPLLSCA